MEANIKIVYSSLPDAGIRHPDMRSEEEFSGRRLLRSTEESGRSQKNEEKEKPLKSEKETSDLLKKEELSII